MRKLLNDGAGFTLVELMITIVIVGVLAAVAIPLSQANVKRGKAAEADAALGAIRTHLRVYYAENTNYPTEAIYIQVDSIGINIAAGDLNGTYFNTADYKYKSTNGVTYTIQATGSGSQAGINRQIDQAGTLSDF